MSALIRKDAPLLVRLFAYALFGGMIVSGVLVLPLLLWTNTLFNLTVLGVVLHQDGYARATFHISEYEYWHESSASDIPSIKHYFSGTVHGQPQVMKTTFAAYSPELRRIMSEAPRGTTPVDIAIEVWHNPGMRDAWFAREQVILPYAPDLFASLYGRLGGYVLLWLLFAVVWLSIYWLPKVRARATRSEGSR